MTVTTQQKERGRLSPLLSSREVAEYLNVAVATLYRWNELGIGPPGFQVGRHRRYRREDVDEWLERQGRP